MGIVHIEIDGVELEAETGSMIIEIADEAGMHIPRFCYHKKLSVAANCRMCLVDVSNIPKAVPACATPVAEGMKILTGSTKARIAQKAVMEFLLINHPLDCPICDQGGECELQDIAVGYGNDVSRFTEGKRVVKDKNIGSLIETDMTRCIHCTRCVRFGTEIAGIREMGATGRGEHMEIGTFVEKSMESEVSGNIIDLCPVGALTAKPSRYKARAWELETTPSVAPHDCLGSNVDIHHRRGEMIRVVPRENEKINEVWLSDRDRFSYDALVNAPRLTQPKIKKNGEWQVCSWEEALIAVSEGIKGTIEQFGAEQFGTLMSPSSSCEEFYLAQKLMRGIECHNIDHRLRRMDFSTQHEEPMFPGVEFTFDELEEMDATLLIGTHLRFEQPLLAIRVRKSTRYGKVFSINSMDSDANFKIQLDLQVAPSELLKQLQGVLASLIKTSKDPIHAELIELCHDVDITPEHEAIAKGLSQQENACVLVGHSILEHSHSGQLTWLARHIALLSQSKYGELTHGANAAGGHIAGALPHRIEVGRESDVCGANTLQMLTRGMKGFLLMNTEPELDSSYLDAARVSLLKAEFVVSMTPFAEGEFLDYADVLLPIAGFGETSGTFVNATGEWQAFSAAVKAKGEARPAWKVLRVLGNLLEVEHFDYTSSKGVIDELKQTFSGVSDKKFNSDYVPETLETGGECPPILNIYDSDSLVRRSPSLQKTVLAEENWRREQISGLSVASTQPHHKEQEKVMVESEVNAS